MSNPANDTVKPTLSELSILALPNAKDAAGDMEPRKLAGYLVDDFFRAGGKAALLASDFWPHQLTEAVAHRIDWLRREGLCW